MRGAEATRLNFGTWSWLLEIAAAREERKKERKEEEIVENIFNYRTLSTSWLASVHKYFFHAQPEPTNVQVRTTIEFL